ncbi:14882_t:CDS:2, partial [Racocetra persica]
FASVKEMFDPVVNKILELILDQLKASKEKCSAIFLVGRFAKSAYLLDKFKENFRFQVDNICILTLPIAAVIRGASYYELNANTVKTHVLKWTFGIECFAKCGSKVDINEPFSKVIYPVRPNKKSEFILLHA